MDTAEMLELYKKMRNQCIAIIEDESLIKPHLKHGGDWEKFDKTTFTKLFDKEVEDTSKLERVKKDVIELLSSVDINKKLLQEGYGCASLIDLKLYLSFLASLRAIKGESLLVLDALARCFLMVKDNQNSLTFEDMPVTITLKST